MTISVRIKVLFFGTLKDHTGIAEESIEVSPGATSTSVFDSYAARCPALETHRASIAAAVNQQFVRRQTPLNDGDELAFLPPVSGGAGPYTHAIEDPAGHLFALTRSPIDTTALRSRLLAETDGALLVFEGVVRGETKGRRTLRLEYACYEAMAVEQMARLGREAAAAHSIGRVAIVHRLGAIEIGEASIFIAVAAPHRAPAYAASRELIDRLKKLVPIWKKEHYADGEIWVEGAWDASVDAQ